MKEKTSNNIIVLGFLMTCMIVIYHCSEGFFEPINYFDSKVSSILNGLVYYFSEVAMYYFFSITGFLLFFNYKNNYLKKIKNRISSLLIPYLLWQLIFSIIMIIVTNNLNWAYIKHIFYSVFCLQQWPPDGPLWYIYAIFILALLSPAVYLIIKNKKYGKYFVLLVTLIDLFIIRYNFKSFLSFATYGYVGNILTYLPAYLIGAYWGAHEKEIENDEKGKMFLFYIIGGIVLNQIIPSYFSCCTKSLLPLLLIFYMPDLTFLRKSKIVNISFVMYAIHYIFDWKVAPIIRNFLIEKFKYAFVADNVTRIMILALVIGVAYVICLLCGKFVPGFLKVLTGGRVKKFSKS